MNSRLDFRGFSPETAIPPVALFGALSANRVIRTEICAKSLKMRAFLG
ncbi:hypothetical protein V1278_000292 [Bradyrhizobium sp. AZCC 1577]